MVKKIFVLFFLFGSHCLEALSLESILQEHDASSLRRLIKKEDHQEFLKALCKEQKNKRKIPFSCFEVFEEASPWCLRLKIKDLNFRNLNLVLKSKSLSPSCSKHLKEKQKILLYRQKDRLLFEESSL